VAELSNDQGAFSKVPKEIAQAATLC